MYAEKSATAPERSQVEYVANGALHIVDLESPDDPFRVVTFAGVDPSSVRLGMIVIGARGVEWRLVMAEIEDDDRVRCRWQRTDLPQAVSPSRR